MFELNYINMVTFNFDLLYDIYILIMNIELQVTFF